jgi:type I restriction enzyme S subunit
MCRSTGIRSSRLRLYPEKFLDIPIVCPPREEQEAIAQYLTSNAALVARFIRDKRRQIELLTQQTGITLEQLVTSGTTSSDTVKDTSVGTLPSHWDLLPLKRCVSTPITDGPHETPTLLDQGIDFMSAESMVDGKLDFSRRRGYISREDHERFSRKCRPQREDIFMCKSGATTGKLAVVETDQEFSVWSPLALIRADRARVLPRFLYLALQAKYVQRQVQDIWSYGTQPNLGMGAMERLLIALPPSEEQVRVIEAAEDKVLLGKAAKELLGGQIKLIREFQTRLIADVVTGKLDVRQVPIQSVEPELDLLIADDDTAEGQEDAFDEAEGVAVGNE